MVDQGSRQTRSNTDGTDKLVDDQVAAIPAGTPDGRLEDIDLTSSAPAMPDEALTRPNLHLGGHDGRIDGLGAEPTEGSSTTPLSFVETDVDRDPIDRSSTEPAAPPFVPSDGVIADAPSASGAALPLSDIEGIVAPGADLAETPIDPSADGDAIIVGETRQPAGGQPAGADISAGAVAADSAAAGEQAAATGDSSSKSAAAADGEPGETDNSPDTGANHAPVARDDSAATTEDFSLTIDASDLLADDSDVDGDSLSVATLGAPAHGTVVDNGDGTFTHTPEADYNGADSFVSDGNGATATVNLTVDPATDAPVASDVAYSGPAEDGAAQTFAYSASDADTSDSLSYTIVSQPAEGTVSDNGDGTFAFDPGADFQDLGAGETRQVSFTYQADDGNGGTDTATATITIAGSNDGPVASDVAYSGPAEDGAAQNFAYSASDAETSDTVTYSIVSQPAEGTVADNGDGTFAFDPGADFQDLGTGETRQVSFTYQADDGNGGTDTATATITIAGSNDGPVASDVAYSGPAEDGAAQTFAYSASDADTSDSLSYTITTQPAEGTVADNGDGTFAFDAGADFQDLGAGETRQVSFTYQAADGNGGTDTATATITIAGSNDGPVASDVAYSGPAEDGAAQTFAYSASDADTSDTVTYSIVSQPAEGTVSDNGDGTFAFDPGADFQDLAAGETRQVSFTYQADDGNGGTDTATATITIAGSNDGPVASDVAYSGPAEDGAAQTFAYSASDADTSDSLSYTITTQPAEGTVSDNGDGTFAFDPGADFQDLAAGETRQISFTYQADDGNGGTDTATATITIAGSNDGPVASDVAYSGPAEDGAAQTFAYSASDADTSDSLSYTITTQPAEGTVSDNGDGTFAFDPGADFQDLAAGETRQVSFTYQADDGNGGTDTATATITIAGSNDGPVASDVVYSGPAEDGAAQTFAYSASDADTSDSLSYTITTQPAEGTVADNGDGTFAFDPGADFQDLGTGETRQVSFTYQADDGNGGTDTATATITIAGSNDGPVASDVAYSGPAEDGAAQTFAYSASDADTSDSLSYTITTQPAEGTVADNGDGTFAFDPGADFQDLGAGETRQVSFTYQADDGNGGTDTATATITIAGSNDGPVASDVAYSGPAEDGAAQNFAYSASDADTSDTVTYSIVSQPAEGTVADNGDGTFAFDPGADFQDLAAGETRQVSFTYQAADGNGGTDTATATITVAGSNDGPVASDVAYSGPAEDGAAQTFAYGAADADTSDTVTYSIVSQPAEGTVADNGDGTFAFDPGADFQHLGAGETRQVSFTYQADDGNGGTDTATATITIAGSNDGPVASDVAYSGPAEDGAARNFAYSASDADTSDSLSYTIVSQPAEGTVSDNGDGTFAFDPGADFQDLGAGETRQISFTYQADDGNGGTDTATATITIAGSNDGPVASDVAYSGPAEDGAAQTFAYGAADADTSDTVTYSIVSQPAEGTVADNGDGTFAFDPGADFQHLGAGETRQVSFTYQADDGNGGTDTATATITIAGSNDGPVASDVAYSGPAEDGAARNFAYSASDADTSDSLSYTIVSQPAEGTVSDNGDGTFAFDPGADFQDLGAGETRQISFTYQADDGNGGTDTATATITIAGSNDGPVASDDSTTTDQDTDLVINANDLLANDSDLDSDTLTITSFTDPANGTVADNGDGTFTYTPDAGHSGADSFSYTVSDGNGATATATVNVAVTPNQDFDGLGAGTDDSLDGANGNVDDTLYGGAGDDTLNGKSGDDALFGGSGDDNLDGGTDNDELYGGDGTDELLGGNNNDTLYGGAGADTLTGGKGTDSLFGEGGDDSFIFDASNGGFGQDWVDGGAGSNDTIQLNNVGNWTAVLDNGDTFTSADSVDDYGALTSDSGTITFDTGDEINFEGIEKLDY